MQEQYNKLKKQYSDCILLFRLGDFYEGFNEDAKVLAKVLGITLTGRGKGESRIPMAGIPHHALNQYLPKLVQSGNKVAIAEQLEEAQPGKLVEREVTKVITAGTITDDKSLISSENNYLAAMHVIKNKNTYLWGFSYIDLTTADFVVDEVEGKREDIIPEEIILEIQKLGPREILISDKNKSIFENQLKDIPLNNFEEDYARLDDSRKLLLSQFQTKSLKGFGIETFTVGIIAAAKIIEYLEETQKTDLKHIKSISAYNKGEFMKLDEATIRNLELLSPAITSQHDSTVYNVLNSCETPMGQRMLRYWLVFPLLSEQKINERLDAVEYFYNNTQLLESVKEYLSGIYDIERIIGKIGLSSANARDLKALQSSLERILSIQSLDLDSPASFITKIMKTFVDASEVNYIIDLVNSSIKEDPSVNLNEGNMIKEGYDESLDEIRSISKGGKSEITKIQTQEIESTGISSLKVKFNNVFGYYIEVSRSNLDKVPAHYVRKQTLVNAERFITDDLKVLEEKVLGAEEKIIKLEYDIFCKIRDDIAQFIPTLQEISKAVARLDIISNFAHLALHQSYVKPDISEETDFEVKGSRHIVVERLSKEPFVSNDLQLNKKQNLMILTGPNMSGKSTYIRQVALLSLLAQIGCFVPAEKASMPVVDRIFTRVGASDNLVQGESTFMVEMNETANILNNATEKSLIILDEVGRGTSTYDGVALAWSITEFIHEKLKSTTLFATHYHELVELAKQYKRVVNYNVQVKESGEEVTFMRKIVSGSTDKSYGIHVAKLAGVPDSVVRRAKNILSTLEDTRQSNSKSGLKNSKPVVQISFLPSDSVSDEGKKDNEILDKFEALKKKLESIDVNNMTPIDALKNLEDLKKSLNK